MIISAMTAPAHALPLTDWGVIRASGADAATFLHSQLTQDFSLLDRQHARLAGYCTAKGRLLATMVGWKASDDELLLALPLELLPATLKRLSMFVLRAKCKLSDASQDLAVWGLLGTPPAEAWTLQPAGTAVQIALPAAPGQGRSLWVQPSAEAAPDLPRATPADWAWAELESGIAWVRGATVEAFVPQMINLELVGGVSFKKGCYPGQEVVARSQYRGTLKRRLQLFETDADVAVGDGLFTAADPEQPAGLVAGVARRDGVSLVAAEVKLAALEAGAMHLRAADGPALTLRPLPYEIPAQD